ncbi:MAG: T9SS type A sorting domain-containing protein [Candidatus Marinimicrobia bacterium]|nr:T9SS type A sorting domain-containing protein [Candidatus Neomarinimicrobiota bacterium]
MKKTNRNFARKFLPLVLNILFFSNLLLGQTATATGGNVVGDYWNNTNTGMRVQFSLSQPGAYIIKATCTGSSNIRLLTSVGAGSQTAGSKTVNINQSTIESIYGRADGETFNIFIIRQDNDGAIIDTLTTATNFEFQETAPQATQTPVMETTDDTGVSNSDNITNLTTVTISVTGTTAGLRISTDFVEDKLAGQNVGVDPTSDGSDLSYSLNLSAGDGYYTVRTYSRDSFGSEGSSERLYLYLDTQAPSAPSVFNLIDDSGYSDSDWLTNDPDPRFGIRNSDLSVWRSNGFNWIYGRALLYRDGTAQADSVLETNSDDSVVVIIPTISTDGSYQIQAQIVDVAGNRGPLSSEVTLQLDKQADQTDRPSLKSTSDSGFSDSDDWTNDDTPTFTVTGFDIGDSVYITVNDVFKVGSWTTSGTLNLTIPDVSGLADEVDISIEAVAVDSAGNESVISPELTITVDTTIPVATATPNLTDDTGILNDDDYTNVTRPGFTVTAEDASDSVFLYFDGSLVARRVAGAATLTFETADYLASQSDGDYTVTYKLTDKAGNESVASSGLDITIDSSDPNPPTNIDLVTGDDTGTYNNDEITSVREPRFTLEFAPEHITDADSILVYMGGVLKASSLISASPMTMTSSTLNSGIYAVTASILDSAGNSSSVLTGPTITIDYTDPDPANVPDLQTEFDTGFLDNDNLSKDSTITFTISNVSEGDSVYLFFDADTVVREMVTESGATTIELVVTDQDEGQYEVGARLRDLAGNLGAISPLLDLELDQTRPARPNLPDLTTDTGLLLSDNLTNDPTPSFTISNIVTDDSIRLLFDGVVVKTVVNPAGSSISITAPNTVDGSYSVTTVTQDPAGNLSNVSIALNITIDTQAPNRPSVPDLIEADDSGFSSIDNLTSVTTPKFLLSGLPAASYDSLRVYRDGDTLLVATRMTQYNTKTVQVTEALASGTYPVTVVVIDSAGNTSLISNSLSLTIETDAPTDPDGIDLRDISDTGTLSNDELTADITPSFTVSGVSSGDSVFIVMNQAAVIDTIGRKLSSGVTTNIQVDDISGSFSEGAITVRAYAKNSAGNSSAVASSATLEIVLDTSNDTTPTIILEGGSDTGISSSDRLTSDTTPTFTITNIVDTDSLYLVVGIDTVARGLSNGVSFNITSTTLASGTYQAQALSRDYAGNLSPSSSSISVRIDTEAPNKPSVPDLFVIDDSGFSSIDNLTNVTTPRFQLYGLPESYDSLRVYRDGDTLLVATRMTGPYSQLRQVTNVMASGTYPITVTVTDSAGNTSVASDALSITIETESPDDPTNVDLVTSSDTGTDDTDNLTSDITPVFNVAGVTAGDSVFVVMIQGGTIDTIGRGLTNDVSVDITTEDISAVFSEGGITVRAYAKNTAGNTSEYMSSAAVDITLDISNTATPAVELVSGSDTGISQGDQLTNDTTPTFAVSNIAVNDSLYLIVGTDTVARDITDGVVYNLTSTGLADATYQATALGRDYAGNLSPVSSALSVTVDTQAPAQPAVPDLLEADDTGFFSDDNITSETQPDIIISGLSAIQDSVILTLNGPMTSNTRLVVSQGVLDTITVADLLAPGDYTAEVVAIDYAGNQSVASPVLYLTIDTQYPATPFAPDLQTAFDTGQESIDNLTNIDVPQFDIGNLDNGTFIRLYSVSGPDTALIASDTLTDGSNAITLTSTQLVDGLYDIFVTSQDTAGNASQSGDLADFRLDTESPSALIALSDSLVKALDVSTVTVQFSDGMSSSPTIRVDYADGDSLDTTFLSNAGQSSDSTWFFNVTIPDSNDGAATITITGEDNAGNTIPADSVSGINLLRLDNTDPAFTDFNIASDAYINHLRFGWTLTEISGRLESGTIFWDQVGGIVNDVTTILSVNELLSGPKSESDLNDPPALVDGTKYDIIFTAIDSAGNTGRDTILSVTYDVTPPSANLSYSHDYATAGTEVSIQANFTESTADTPSISIAYNSGAGITDNGTMNPLLGSDSVFSYLSIIPSGVSNEGVAVITLTATDLANNALTTDSTYFRDVLQVDSSPVTAIFEYANLTQSHLNELGNVGDTIRITTRFNDQMRISSEAPVLNIQYADSADSIDSLFYSLRADGDSTWIYEIILPDSTKNSGSITVTVSGADLAGNEVTTLINNDIFIVDNTPPDSFNTGAVSAVAGNIVTGWINGSNDSLKIKAPILIPDLEGTVRLAFAVPAKMDTASTWAIAGDPIDLSRAANPDSFYADIDTIITALNNVMIGDLEQGDEILTQVIKSDQAGNLTTGLVSSQKLLYDVLPPVAGNPIIWNSTSPNTLISNDSLHLSWGAYSEPSPTSASGIDRYEWAVETGGPGWTEFMDWTSVSADTSIDTALALTHANIYRLKLRSFDVAGNQSASDQTTTSFLRLNSAPLIAVIDSVVVYEDIQYIDTIEISDPDILTLNGDSFTYQLHTDTDTPMIPPFSDPVAAEIDTNGIITWTPLPTDTGRYYFNVFVDDNWGFSDTLQYLVNALPVNDAPIAEFGDTTVVLVEDSLRSARVYLNPYISDEDNLISELEWIQVIILDTVNNPGYPEIGYNYPPDEPEDPVVLTKTGSNPVSADSEAYQLLAALWAANPPLTVELSRSNDSSFVTITADSNYFGAVHRLVFFAQDPDSANAIDTLSLIVESRNDPPVLTTISTQSILENDSLKLDLGAFAYDVDDSSLTFTVTALTNPDSLTISQAQYISTNLGDTIVFTPNELWSDSALIQVIITDDSDASDTAEFILDIIRVPRPHLSIAVVQNSAFANHFEIIINDTLEKTIHCDVTIDGTTINLDTVTTYTYIGRTTFTETVNFTVSAYAQGIVGDTTITRAGAVVLARSTERWTGASPDGLFQITGEMGTVPVDQPVLVIDSTLFEYQRTGQAAYRLGAIGMNFEKPVLLSFISASDELALYYSADGEIWQELPTMTVADRLLAWTAKMGYYKTGPRTLFVPEETALRPNYPNPFNPVTIIEYDLGFLDGPQQKVTIVVFDLLGRQVVELFDGHQTIGRHAIRWDSRNARGVPSASGVYFVRMMAGKQFVKTQKIMLLR